MNKTQSKKIEVLSKIKLPQDARNLLNKIEKALASNNADAKEKANTALDNLYNKVKQIAAKQQTEDKGQKVSEKTVVPKSSDIDEPAQKEEIVDVVNKVADPLQDAIESDPALKGFNRKATDVLRDAGRPAMTSGRRVSRKGWKNQYGESKGGRVYYESRENRMDRKAPITSTTKMPWLEDGGHLDGMDFEVIEIMDGNEKVVLANQTLSDAKVYAMVKRHMGSECDYMVRDGNGMVYYSSNPDMFAKGGYMADGGEMRSYKTFVEEYPDKKIYVRVKFAGADKDVQHYTANEENKKRAISFAKRLAEKNNGTYEGFKTYTYAKGGYMEHGGELKQGDKIVILGTEYDFVKYETDTSQGYEEERVVLKNEDGIRSYPKDMVEAYSNYKMAKGGEINSQNIGSPKLEMKDFIGKKLTIELGSSGKTQVWNQEDFLEQIGKVLLHNLYDTDFAYSEFTDIGSVYRTNVLNSAVLPLIEVDEINKTLNDFFKYGFTPYSSREKVLFFKLNSKDTRKWIDNWFETTKDNPPKVIKMDELKKEYYYFRLDYAREKPYILEYGGYMAHGGEMDKGGKYYVIDAKDGKTLSKGFDTEDEAKVEMYEIFENSNNPFLTIKKMADGGYMAHGGSTKFAWQNAQVGDSVLVIAENKMGTIVTTYGRRIHVRFPDGSEKTYFAEDLEFISNDEFAKGGELDTSYSVWVRKGASDDEEVVKSNLTKAQAKKLMDSLWDEGEYYEIGMNSSVYEYGGYMAKGEDYEYVNTFKRFDSNIDVPDDDFKKFVDAWHKQKEGDEIDKAKYVVLKRSMGNYLGHKTVQEMEDYVEKTHHAARMEYGGYMAKGGIVVTSIKNIPNFQERLDEGKITYRGLGLGKLYNNFYDIAGESGYRIKVDGKEYYITETEFNSFSRGSDGKLRVKFDAPYRKFEDGGVLGQSDFDSLKKGDKISITFSSPIKRENEVDLMVQSKTLVNKGKRNEKEKITLVNLANPSGVKFYGYKDTNNDYIGFAIGDLAIYNVKLTEKFAKGGKIGFESLSKKVASHYVGKKVPSKYKKEYGETYDKAEAKEVGDKVAAKVYRQQLSKMEKGGSLEDATYLARMAEEYAEREYDKKVKPTSTTMKASKLPNGKNYYTEITVVFTDGSKKTFEQEDFEDFFDVDDYAKGGELAMGIKTEMEEHGMSKVEATKTAKDHLREHPNYYSKMKKAGLEDGGTVEFFDYSNADLEKLPYRLDKYFTKPKGTIRIPLDKIKPIRAREKGVKNANKFMRDAYDGKMEKREPITVYKSAKKGHYILKDGNSTYANAKFSGWKDIYAVVVKNEKLSASASKTTANSVLTLAKKIRKEGEKWQDAIQRAKKMRNESTN